MSVFSDKPLIVRRFLMVCLYVMKASANISRMGLII